MPLSRHPAVVPRDTSLPPAPPGVRYVRVPIVGIVIATDARRRRVDRVFHWPMIVLALAVLPLLIVEFVQKPEGWLRWAIEIGFLVIWLAFVVEFVIKVAIAECRVEYVRRNWLDIIIIVLPLLRPLRVARIARTTKVFRLRGVAMKFARTFFTLIVGMDATDRLLRKWGLKPNSARVGPERMTRHALEQEVKRLRRLNDRWEAWYEQHERHVDDRGGPCATHPRPGRADEDAGTAGEAALE